MVESTIFYKLVKIAEGNFCKNFMKLKFLLKLSIFKMERKNLRFF